MKFISSKENSDVVLPQLADLPTMFGIQFINNTAWTRSSIESTTGSQDYLYNNVGDMSRLYSFFDMTDGSGIEGNVGGVSINCHNSNQIILHGNPYFFGIRATLPFVPYRSSFTHFPVYISMYIYVGASKENYTIMPAILTNPSGYNDALKDSNGDEHNGILNESPGEGYGFRWYQMPDNWDDGSGNVVDGASTHRNMHILPGATYTKMGTTNTQFDFNKFVHVSLPTDPIVGDPRFSLDGQRKIYIGFVLYNMDVAQQIKYMFGQVRYHIYHSAIRSYDTDKIN